MANNTYVNKVVFGNDTLLDLTSDTVTANDVTSGVTFHDKTGAPLIGQFSPTLITPDDDTPAILTAGSVVEPTTGGYAVEDIRGLTPSNNSPGRIVDGAIHKALAPGYAIGSYMDVRPDDDNPPIVYTTSIYRITYNNGFLIKNAPVNKVPSNSSPPSIGSGSIIRNYSNSTGYLIQSPPIDKTPSDSSPASVSSGSIIRPSDSGYLYKTLQAETETTLWENSSPTSNFNQQVVDLTKNGVAEAYTNYKRIRFYYRQSNSNDETAYVDYAKEIIDAWPLQGAAISNICAIGMLPHSAGAYAQVRQVRRGSTNPTTSFWISLSYRVNAAANNQNYGIPTKITGIK